MRYFTKITIGILFSSTLIFSQDRWFLNIRSGSQVNLPVQSINIQGVDLSGSWSRQLGGTSLGVNLWRLSLYGGLDISLLNGTDTNTYEFMRLGAVGDDLVTRYLRITSIHASGSLIVPSIGLRYNLTHKTGKMYLLAEFAKIFPQVDYSGERVTTQYNPDGAAYSEEIEEIEFDDDQIDYALDQLDYSVLTVGVGLSAPVTDVISIGFELGYRILNNNASVDDVDIDKNSLNVVQSTTTRSDNLVVGSGETVSRFVLAYYF